MDNGLLFVIVLLSVSVSTLIDFVMAAIGDSAEGGNTASKSMSLGVVVKIMFILFIVLPILSSVKGG